MAYSSGFLLITNIGYQLNIYITNSLFENAVVLENAGAISISCPGAGLLFESYNLTFFNIYTDYETGSCIYI